MSEEINWEFYDFCKNILQLSEGDAVLMKHWEAYEEYKNGK